MLQHVIFGNESRVMQNRAVIPIHARNFAEC